MTVIRSAALAVLVLAGAAHAQVRTDGTLGPKTSLSGPAYSVTESLGRRVGANLFHSFTTFNIATGQSAVFSGTPGTANVISRVTGGAPSSIDGTLRSSIAGANFYFINPSGLVFGPNARLDVGGSFHASTAGYLKLGADGRFDAVNTGASRLTVDAPSAFGFYGAPAAITVDRSILVTPAGATLSLVGGKLMLKGFGIDAGVPAVLAQGGKVYLAAIGSAGEVTLKSNGISASSAAFAPIVLDRALVVNERTNAAPGPIFIRGGQLSMNDAAVSARNNAPGAGAGIDIQLTGDLSMRERSVIRSSGIRGGDAGDTRIRAANVSLSGFETIIESSSIDRQLGLGGNAGAIDIEASGAITLSDRAEITSLNFFGAGAGEMHLRARSLALSGNAVINASTYGNGAAGKLVIDVEDLTMRSGGHLLAGSLFDSSLALNAGPGGDVVVNASGAVDIAGSGSGIFTVTNTFGRGGSITIRAGSVRVADNGRISSASIDSENFGINLGDAGSIDITASSTVGLESGGAITTEALTAGGGIITLRVQDVLSLVDSSITTSVGDGAGNGGDINIDPVFVVLINGKIIAQAVGGNGGDITIVTDFLLADPSSLISASSRFGLSGKVVITAPELDVASRLNVLSAAYIDPASRLRESCAARAGAGNSFVGTGRGGLPASPQSAAFAAYGSFAPLAALPEPGARSCPS